MKLPRRGAPGGRLVAAWTMAAPAARTSGRLPLLLFAAAAAALLGLVRANPAPPPMGAGGGQAEAFKQYLNQLRQEDTCGTVYTSRAHGYGVREYRVQTNDKYELRLHRLVHPEQLAAGAEGQQQQQPQQPEGRRNRKPYLLVHGLIGTSASFVTNVEQFYRAPPRTFDASGELSAVLEARAHDYQYEWQSSAESARTCSAGEPVAKLFEHKRRFADSLELQFDGEHMRFGRHFRQAYKKFRLPKAALGFTCNSLAMTLANFGYDVWLLNLRGNKYSRAYNGPLSAQRAEYWDFDLETMFREDLAASIKFVAKETRLAPDQQLGLVTYSYSAALALGLLTKFPKYQRQLQPIVMLAPTLLTGTSERGKFKYFMKLANSLIGRNGPFPSWNRALETVAAAAGGGGGGGGGGRKLLASLGHLDRKLEGLVCSLPVASKLCRLLELIIHGHSKRVASVRGLLSQSRSVNLMQRDHDCGQTSKQILHQIIENLSQESISPHFRPFAPLRQSSMLVAGRHAPARPAIMLLHSDADSISTPAEVAKIRDSATKTLTLVDYLIREPDFEHTDFLFSRRNQYLVNAEVARMVLVHDHLAASFDAQAPPS